MVILQGRTYHKLDSKEIKVQHKTRTSLCWRKGSRVVDDNTNHRGQGWSFSSWIPLISWKESKCWWWSRHFFVEGIHEEAIDQRLHQAKGLMQQKIIGATDTTQTRGQVCCSRWNDMTRKIDVSLAHRRKWCSGNKDQVAQLKSSRQWYSQTG